MNRHTFVYLFVSLMMVALVFGSLPLAVAETTNAPVGVTETPTTAPTATKTTAPTATNTAVPAPVNTSAPAPTSTVVPAPTNTPTAPAPVGLPKTGGAAPEGGAAPWILALVVAVVVSLGALTLDLRTRAHRPTRR